MKKLLITNGIICLVLAVPIYVTYAGFGQGAGFDLKTRFEATSDNRLG